MKLIFVLILSVISYTSHAQTEATTNVIKTITAAQIGYNFISNRAIDSFQEERWEQRFKVIHPELEAIDINHVDQTVQLTFLQEISQETLETILSRFQITSYQISE